MTDKELMLQALEFIKHKNGYTNIKSYWIDLDDETQTRIKLKLEDAGFAVHHIYNVWEIRITTDGFKIQPEDLTENGLLKRRGWINFRTLKDKYWLPIAIIVWVIGVFTPGLSEMANKYILRQKTEEPIILKRDTVVVYEIDTMHDTIYLPDSLLRK